MLEQSGIMAAPGMGSVLLALVLFCYLIVSKIIKTRKESKDVSTLKAEALPPSQAVVVNYPTGVITAIIAAVNEYRKYNS